MSQPIQALLEELHHQLAVSEKRLLETQTLSRIGSWDWNVKTNKVVWSEMLYQLLGVDREVTPTYELALHHVLDEDKENYELQLGEAIEQKKEYYLENRVVHSDGSIIDVVSRGKCSVNERGELLRMFGTIQDVTHHNKLLQEKNAAEESEKLKSAFLANITHELLTPLNAIVGFTKLLKAEQQSREMQQQYIDHVTFASDRLKRMLTEVLDYTKIEASNQELIYARCNLNDLMDTLLKEFEIQNQNKDVTITNLKSLQDDQSNIDTDVLKLTQILSNLISNAVKYTNRGKIVFGYKISGKELQFEVTDTGIGISPENQEDIFNRFFQVSEPKQSVSGGVGLGMCIADGLVKLFGGRIWMNSTLGSGSSFYFTIPYLANEQELASPHTMHDKEENFKKTILLVEDDYPTNLLFDIEIGPHFNIISASDGAEAIELFSKFQDRIDIVFMDLRMPLMDGFEAAQEIRKINRSVPIIAHSAQQARSQLDKYDKAGFTDSCDKPASIETVRELFTKYVAQ